MELPEVFEPPLLFSQWERCHDGLRVETVPRLMRQLRKAAGCCLHRVVLLCVRFARAFPARRTSRAKAINAASKTTQYKATPPYPPTAVGLKNG